MSGEWGKIPKGKNFMSREKNWSDLRGKPYFISYYRRESVRPEVSLEIWGQYRSIEIEVEIEVEEIRRMRREVDQKMIR